MNQCLYNSLNRLTQRICSKGGALSGSYSCFPHIHFHTSIRCEIMQTHFHSTEVASGKAQLMNSMHSYNRCFLWPEVIHELQKEMVLLIGNISRNRVFFTRNMVYWYKDFWPVAGKCFCIVMREFPSIWVYSKWSLWRQQITFGYKTPKDTHTKQKQKQKQTNKQKKPSTNNIKTYDAEHRWGLQNRR